MIFAIAKELVTTVKELSTKLTIEELIGWVAFFELKQEQEEKAIQNAKDKSQARIPKKR